MKHLLLITDAFPPDFAPRMGYLCKYLPDDWQVTVYTEQPGESHFTLPVPPRVKVHRIKYYHCQNTCWAKPEYAFKHILNMVFAYKDRYFWQHAKAEIMQQNYDAVLCSTFYTFPLLFAHKAAKALGIPLIADLRDIMEQYPQPENFPERLRLWGKGRRINTRRRNRVLRSASALTTVSPWHACILKTCNPNIELIYNGYDSTLFYPIDLQSQTFNIVYTGRMFHTKYQNPELLFQALRELLTEQTDLFTDLRLHWYADKQTQATLRQKYAGMFPAQTFVFHDFVTPEKVPSILHDASIVLVLANKTTANGPHGIMTTKFFEALGVEKPVLCVRSDEACLAETMQKTNAGLAATGTAGIKTFILEKHAEWKRNGFTRQAVNMAEKKKFCREQQAQQFAGLLDKTCRNK